MRGPSLPVDRIATALMGAALAACSTASPPATAESIPPAPSAPSGWASAGSFGGTATGGGMFGADLTLSDAPVAVSAICSGTGSLVVIIADAAATEPIVATSVTFPCTVDDQAGPNRVELTDAPTGEIVASAFVVEGGGTIRHASFNVAIEQPAE